MPLHKSGKDNVMVWGGIFLPRILANMTLIAVNSLNAKEKTSMPHANMYLAVAATVLNFLFIYVWVKPNTFSLKFGNPGKNIPILSDKALFMMGGVVLAGQLWLLCLRTHPLVELAMCVLISVFLWEAINVYVVPGEWKFDPCLREDLFWQNFYILFVFVADVAFLCFISHLLTQGYVKFVWKYRG